MNLLQIALQGIGAVADAFSIAPASVGPVDEEAQKVKAAVAKATAPQPPSAKQQPQPKPAAKPAQLPPVQPVAVQTRGVQSAARNAIDPDLTPDAVRALTDARQQLVEERLAEMAEIRKQQDNQREQTQDLRLKR